MDETPVRFNAKRQYVWACIGDMGVAVTVGIRSAAEINCYFPYYDKPITCDRYPAYIVCHIRQRCRAHILRESEFIMYDKRQTRRQPCCTAGCRSCTARPNLGPLTSAMRTTWNLYVVPGAWQRRTRDQMTGLPPCHGTLHRTCSHSCAIPAWNLPTTGPNTYCARWRYKIHQKMVTVGGKAVLGILMTCLLTWDKTGLNWFEKLSELFWATYNHLR